MDTPQIETRTILVTPEQAARWLQRNTRNRPKKPAAIARYALDMAEGRWHLTHQGIAFAPDGTLLDGQNRLHAVVKANLTVPMPVTFGMDPTAQAVVDDHVRRSVGDVLSLTTNERGLGQRHVAIGMRMHQGLTGPGGHGLTRTEQIAIIERHLDAIEWTLAAIRHRGSRGLTQAAVLAVIARAWYTRDRQRLLAFADALLSGEVAKPERDQAVVVLRNWLLSGGRYGGQAVIEVYAKTERAVVAFLDEERLTKLYAVPEEQFPVPGDPDWPLDARAPAAPRTRFDGTVSLLREWHAEARR